MTAAPLQMTPLAVVLRLESEWPHQWRLEGPKLGREWLEGSDSDEPTGPVRDANWTLVYLAEGQEPWPVATLTVAGPDPVGWITGITWHWPRAAAVAHAALLLTQLQVTR